MSTTTKKQEGGKVVGFSVSDEDYDALQNYANIFAKTLQLDPKTGKPITNEAGKPVMMIESPYIGLLIKVATSAYIMGAELFKQQLVQYQQQQQQQQQQHQQLQHQQQGPA